MLDISDMQFINMRMAGRIPDGMDEQTAIAFLGRQDAIRKKLQAMADAMQKPAEQPNAEQPATAAPATADDIAAAMAKVTKPPEGK